MKRISRIAPPKSGPQWAENTLETSGNCKAVGRSIICDFATICILLSVRFDSRQNQSTSLASGGSRNIEVLGSRGEVLEVTLEMMFGNFGNALLDSTFVGHGLRKRSQRCSLNRFEETR
jgi:hypothetical protein